MEVGDAHVFPGLMVMVTKKLYGKGLTGLDSYGPWKKGFNPFPNDKFETLSNWKSLQTTIS